MTQVGTTEIAERLGVDRKTVNKWIERSRDGALTPPFPSSAQYLNGRPVWKWGDVRRWAQKTGRLTR